MIVARFRDLAELKRARARMEAEDGVRVDMFTPYEPEEDGPDAQASWIPLAILLAGFGGAIGFFLLQVYADTSAYPMNIGGRPNLSWPPYVPNAFEVGVLCAVAAGFVAFLIAAGLPRLYAPVDRFEMMREASRNGFVLLVETGEPARARATLETLHPLRLEEML